MSAKKTVKKKTAAKKVAHKPAAKTKKITAVKDKALTKSQLLAILSEHAEISKKQADVVLDTLSGVIHAHLKKGSVGHFKLPNLVNFKVVTKPARKAREGVNPFTGEKIMIKAKPAHKAIKVSALKALKEMA